jgi:glycosyltransferase involved in cell wall biosynthesis
MNIAIDIKNYAMYSSGIYNATFPRVESFINSHQDWRFFLVGPNKGTSHFESFSNCFNVPVEIPPFKKGEYLYNFINFPFKIYKEKFDLFYSPYFDLLIPKKFNSLITIHDMVHFRFPQLYRKSLLFYIKYIIARNARNAKKIITDSYQSKQDIIRFLNIPDHKIEVIYCSLPSAFLKVAENSHEEDLGLVSNNLIFEGKKKLLYTGGAEHRKNISRLFDAVDELTDEFVLIITGDEQKYFQYSSKISKLKKKKKLYFTGHVTDKQLVALYCFCDLVVYPSLWEGFGYPIIEAMAVKKPIACSNVASLPEIGGDYPTYFDPLSVNEMKLAIERGVSRTVPSDFQFPAKFQGDNLQKRFNHVLLSCL